MTVLRGIIPKVRSRFRALLWRRVPRAMLVLRYIRVFRRVPRLVRPRTFTEHVLVKLLFDRDPKLMLFADKFAVRAYVSKKLGGEQNLTMLYGAVDRPEDIGRLTLPTRFIMKPNHLCGAVEVVRDLAAVERTELETLAASWFRRNYFHERGEWAYRDIRPRVLFEELLGFEGDPPNDYRIYCFSGEPRLLSLTRDHLGPDPTGTLYDVEFRMLPVRHVGSRNRPVAVQGEPPPNYRDMLEIAHTLSAGTDFLRVDLYNLAGRIVFGELTNYPGGGVRKYDPRSFDQTLGSYWRRQ